MENTQEVQVKETGILLSTKRLLSEYRLVSSPGQWKVIATGQANEYVNPNIMRGSNERGGDYRTSILINLKAIEGRKAEAFTKALKEAGERIDVAYLKNLTMVHSINLNGDQQTPTGKIPMRNQEIEITVEWALDVEGEYVLDAFDNKILNITDIKVPSARAATSFSSLSSVEEEVEEPAFEEKTDEE